MGNTNETVAKVEGVTFNAEVEDDHIKYLRSSGSTVRSAVAKLAGNNPSPLWLNPFHQLGSL
jgi:hypothetical protein